jgi:hypothetical protein
MRMSWNYALIIAVMAIVLIVAFRYAYSAGGDRFVQMIERRVGNDIGVAIYPGATKVWPDCGCTVRYVGTFVRGGRYTIVLDKLD